MKRSLALHARLAAEWPHLVEQYKSALPDLASPDAWHETFVTSMVRDKSVASSRVPAPVGQSRTSLRGVCPAITAWFGLLSCHLGGDRPGRTYCE